MVNMMEQQHFGQAQLGFDLGHVPAVQCYEPNRDEVRDDLHGILDAARAVSAVTLWDRRTYLYNKTVFPQMSQWLPEDERDQLCFEFFKELERIELLMAA
ncbi:MAG: hypothetical protein V4460_14365 [Pseudomonadota bacterium]